jgi:hypothetical protein
MTAHQSETDEQVRGRIRLSAQCNPDFDAKCVQLIERQSAMVDDALDYARRTQGQTTLGIPLASMPWLTDALCGLRQAMVLAGPPNCGKSVLTTQMLLDAASAEDTVAISISTEMDPTHDTLVRLLSGRAGVAYRRFLLGDRSRDKPVDPHEPTGLNLRPDAGDRVAREADRLRDLMSCNRLTLCHVRDLGVLAPFTPEGHALDPIEALIASTIDAANAKRAMVLIDYMQLLNVMPTVTSMSDGFRWRDDLERDRYIVECISRMHNAMPYNAIVVVSEQSKSRANAKGDIFAQLGTGRTAYAAGLAVNLWTPDGDDMLEQTAGNDRGARYAFSNPQVQQAVVQGRSMGRSVVIVEVVKGRNGAVRVCIPVVFDHAMHKVTEATSMQALIDLLTESTLPT